MHSNSLLNIVLDEINNFDFLSQTKRDIEENDSKILNNEDFQKQFICDFITKNIETEVIENNITHNDNLFDIQSTIKLTYPYEKNNSINILLNFIGDNINKDNIVWSNIAVNLFDINGKKINFVSYNKSPIKIKNLFVKEFLKYLVN